MKSHCIINSSYIFWIKLRKYLLFFPEAWHKSEKYKSVQETYADKKYTMAEEEVELRSAKDRLNLAG